MDLRPPAVIVVEYVGAGDVDMCANRRSGLVGSTADAVVVAPRSRLGGLTWRAGGLIGWNEFHHQPAVLVGRVGRGQQMRVLRIKGQIEVDITVVLAAH